MKYPPFIKSPFCNSQKSIIIVNLYSEKKKTDKEKEKTIACSLDKHENKIKKKCNKKNSLKIY